MTSSELKQLIAENQTKKAIQRLLEATGKLGDTELQNEVIQQSSKYNDYLKEKAAGTKSQEHFDIQKANIDAALMYIVDKLPPASAKAPAGAAEALAKARPFLIGALVLLLLAVFLIKPSILGLEGTSNKGPFEFTVTLTRPELPDYPPLQNAKLEIKLDNRWDQAPVDEFGDADFKGIPGDFSGKAVPLRLVSDYWELLQDSLFLDGKSATLQTRPNGSLGMVRGSVQAADGQNYLAGVEIRLDNSQLRAISDTTGYFEIPVPVELQREKYSLTATCKGFEPQTLYGYPTSNLDIRLNRVQ